MTQTKRAPLGAARSIHHKDASQCLDGGCDKSAPFSLWPVSGGALGKDNMANGHQDLSDFDIECFIRELTVVLKPKTPYPEDRIELVKRDLEAGKVFFYPARVSTGGRYSNFMTSFQPSSTATWR